MPVVNDSSVVDFDAERAVASALEVTGSDLLLVVEYDGEAYKLLYCADVVADRYEDDQAMYEHFERVHSHAFHDAERRALSEDLFVDSGETRALTTHMENLVALRVLGDDEGLFLLLAPDSSVTAVVEAVEGFVRS
ncbi:hypothetical protein ACFPYI_16110 [Halomarina salina]|uniref:Roadblock/LC7 domain-containing protein n=1 Tax=Halomarina salina TaxID=1872699 RepID=A0ABD5RQC7_9EURY|nr:hypothetical protein [Halomarina salina]